MIGPATSSPSARVRPARPLLRTTLGEVLRRTRLAQRRTLADVARKARVSVPYLSELERGRKEASSEVLAAICVALRVELPDLLAEVRRQLVHGPDRRLPVLRLGAGLRPDEAAADTTSPAGPSAVPAGDSDESDAAAAPEQASSQEAGVSDALRPGAVLRLHADLPDGRDALPGSLAGPGEPLADPVEFAPHVPGQLLSGPGTATCQLAA